MKKILALVLVLLSLVPISLAESTFDLSSMSIDELTALRDTINAELANRNFSTKEVTVPPGKYEIGVDIPAGIYTINSAGNGSAMITTYTTSGTIDLYYSLSETEYVGKLSLQEGQTIEVDFKSVMFAPYSGLGF